MQQDSASFWADIKVYEEQLAANPDSFCFARLAEIYLKVGLVDDALHTTRQGVARHPGYVAGQRALALACHARGLTEECRAALELVTAAVPEDRDALMMLGRLYAEAGNDAAAISAFRTVLAFNAADVECRVELEAVERSGSPGTVDAGDGRFVLGRDGIDAGFVSFDDTPGEALDIIEDVEILDIDEADLIEEGLAAFTQEASEAPPVAPDQDPLFTTTLAELYVQQGIVPKALDIYRSILATDPANAAIRTRIAELESGGAVFDEPRLEDDRPVVDDAFSEPVFNELAVGNAVPDAASIAIAGTSIQGEADGVVVALEGWLENIRRMKACH